MSEFHVFKQNVASIGTKKGKDQPKLATLAWIRAAIFQ